MINALIKIKNPKAEVIYKALKNKREAIEYLLINAIEDREFIEKYADKDLLEFFIHKLEKKTIEDKKTKEINEKIKEDEKIKSKHNNTDTDTEVAF